MKMFKCMGKTAKMPTDMTKSCLIRTINNYSKGVIVVCSICHKVDIDPWTHYGSDTCFYREID